MIKDFFKAENITFLYKKNNVGITNISFSLRQGEIILLLGANGAGKTTLIKTIFNQLIKQSGKYTLLDNELIGKNYRNIAFFPDLNNIPKNLKLSDYLNFIADLNKIDKKQYKMDLNSLNDIFDTEYLMNKKFEKMSSGQKKWALLISVLITKPQVIFFDEPTANLDIDAKQEFIKIFEILKKRNITLFITTHLADEMNKITDHLIILKKGKIKYNQKFNPLTENLIEIYDKYNIKNNNQKINKISEII